MTRQASNQWFGAAGCFLLPTLMLAAGCQTVFPEWSNARPRPVETPQAEQAQFDSCLKNIPVLKVETSRPYHVLRSMEGERESDLAWRACIEKADAVIEDSPAAGATPMPAGDRTSAATKKLVGRAIKYDDQGVVPDER
jgi:hypothetical protein